MQAGIKLIFVFDGAPPELKNKERQRRKDIKIKAEAKLKKAETKEEQRKYASMTSRLTRDMIEDSMDLVKAFGIPVVKAKSEAEAQAGYMVKENQADAIASNDYDSLLFGAPKIIRNLNIVGKKKKAGAMKFVVVKPELLTLSDVLNHLGIDQDQLIVLAMLIGTDYNIGGIKGIGPKGALKLIKEFKNDFESLFDKVEWNNYFDYPWTEVFYLIKNMPVRKDYELSWKDVDEERLKEILIDKHEFSEERVDKIIVSLLKEKEKRKQKGLGDWFK